MSRFNYLIDKVNNAKFELSPFKHIYIENFFEEDDFNEIINNEEIKLSSSIDDENLFKNLFESNYKIIYFPGCTQDYKKYIKFHKNSKSLKTHSACESSGVTLRLYPNSDLTKELSAFFTSKNFNESIASKFELSYDSCKVDGGIQKYLDGYEISPHPDVRKKAATFMININPHKNSENLKHHTEYLQFKTEYRYVQEFWKGNPKIDRSWVPWDWCQSKKIQNKNNSIVLFSPSNDTIHAVKANYDHLHSQRTQIYGNLWYENKIQFLADWEDIEIKEKLKTTKNDNLIFTKKRPILGKFKELLLKKYKSSNNNVGKRSI